MGLPHVLDLFCTYRSVGVGGGGRFPPPFGFTIWGKFLVSLTIYPTKALYILAKMPKDRPISQKLTNLAIF